MAASLDSGIRQSPRHLWVVGIVALLWNAVGAMDYLMTQTRNESYMSQFTPEQLSFFYGFPTWVVAFWAIAVWAGVLGAVLLLMRKRLAVPVFVASFLAMVVTSFHNYVLSNGAEVTGLLGLGFSALIFLIAAGLIVYARAMNSKGALA